MSFGRWIADVMFPSHRPVRWIELAVRSAVHVFVIGTLVVMLDRYGGVEAWADHPLLAAGLVATVLISYFDLSAAIVGRYRSYSAGGQGVGALVWIASYIPVVNLGLLLMFFFMVDD